MKDIVVEGIGVICNIGTDVDAVWDALSKDTEVTFENEPIKYKSIFPAAKKRRMTPYSDTAVYTAKAALDDADVSAENIGTIYTSGYCASQANLKFMESLRKGDPELCSPTVFANTVSNAFLGNICINLNLKGVSTILVGSNNWSYSQGLIEKGDAEYILTGGVEEYCKELEQSFREKEDLKNEKVKEGAVSFLITDKKNSKHAYARYVESIAGDIGGNPTIDRVDEKEAYEMMVDMINELKEKYTFDAVFTSCNGSYFDDVEKKAFNDTLGENATYVQKVKS